VPPLKRVSEADVKLVNTSDADIGQAFLADKSQQVVVTWNPIVLNVLASDPSAEIIFDSSQIPGEIIDSLYVRTEVLERNPEVGYALMGAWFETMQRMYARGPGRDQVRSFIAESVDDTLASYEAQLETTEMYHTPQMAVDFTANPALKTTMEKVRTFSFDHGLFGEGHSSVDSVGIEFPDGTTMGSANNVKLRFTNKYQEAFVR